MHLLEEAIVFGLLSSSLVAVGAVGFTLQYGVTNVLNLAYGAVMTTAIFVTYALHSGAGGLPIELALGAVWGAVFSVAVSLLLINPVIGRGGNLPSIAIATISIGLIVQYGLEAIAGSSVRNYSAASGCPVHVLAVTVGTTQIYLFGLAIVLMVAVHLLLQQTRVGLAMRAMAADAPLARTCGMRTNRIRALTWAVSGALCGMAGVLLGATVGAFDSTTGNNLFIFVVAAAILGGIGKPYGAMLGAIIVAVLSELAAAYWSPDYKDVIASAIIVAVLLLRPRGLLSEFSSEREVAR